MHSRTALAALVGVVAIVTLGACERVPVAQEEAADAGAQALTCPIKHKSDAKFTGWPATTECQEWPQAPVDGTYGKLYVDYDDKGTLHILNDWHLCTTKTPAGFYNLFQITTGGGTQYWMTRVMRSRVHVWLNGNKIGVFSRGAAGFGPSPSKDEDHTIYEFSLPNVEPGSIAMKLGDPGGAPFVSPEESIVMDPKGYTGVLAAGGGVTLKAELGPLLVAVEPATTEKAQTIALVGYDLGAKAGVVSVGGQQVKIASWAAGKVEIEVPKLANGKHPITLATADGKSANVVMLVFDCAPACADKTCGPDGCGGSCGACGSATACSDGQCVCVPNCTAKVCGDDGCGGKCGQCGAGKQCNFGVCECAATCSGKQCGDDGCGGTCGGCIGSKAKCVANTCECTVDCGGKNCGDNGCAGQCGTCDKNETCTAGKCLAK